MVTPTCQGCENAATDFQCPLCQAECQETQGFYCSQECFATNWAEHRGAFHKSGVVKEKRKVLAPSADEDAEKKKGKQKRSRAQAVKEAASTSSDHEDEDAELPPMYLPWPWMPSVPSLSTSDNGLISPSLAVDCPRAVVGAAAGDTALDSFWPQTVVAANYAAQCLAHSSTARVLVVAGDVRSAHAFAWAARGAGLTGQMRLAVNAAQTAMLEKGPASLFTAQRRLVVATNAVVRAVGGAEANSNGAAALWFADAEDDAKSSDASALITLPDVPEAGDLQGVRTRAVFFVSCVAAAGKGKRTKAEAAAAVASTTSPVAEWASEEALTHAVVSAAALEKLLPGEPLFAEYDFTLLWQPMPTIHNVLEDSDGEEEEEEEEKEKGKKDKSREGTDAEADADNGEAVFTVTRQQCISDKLDNDLSTGIANGDTASVLQHLTRVYSSDPGYYEEVLFNALCCDWGHLSVAHAHHSIAHTLRRMTDASERFSAAKGGSLADATLRAAVRLVRLLPPMMAKVTEADKSTQAEEENPKRKRAKTEAATGAAETPLVPPPTARELQDLFNYHSPTPPNLQLQATLCCLFPIASPGALDTLATSWGVSHYLEGPKVLQAVSTARKTMVERITSRYTIRLGKPYASYLAILAHLLYDAVATFSLTVEDVAQRLLWNLTLAEDVGTLPAFLNDCFLLPDNNNDNSSNNNNRKGKKAKAAALSSRKAGNSEKPNRVELLRAHAVRAAKAADYVRLPWKSFPLTGLREREIAQLHKAAVEEVLMAMPRTPRPMYVGDVGNLIGKWFRFNARFDGVLGVTLTDFLSKHPEEFQLAGRLVTRRRAGQTEQVRVRFDNDDQNDDSDGEDGGKRKARDREFLTGNSASARKKAAAAREKELPSRARKKRAVKAFNKERFNRNYKTVDPSARVPGYIKRGPRRITGRGKKPNKRVVKRGCHSD